MKLRKIFLIVNILSTGFIVWMAFNIALAWKAERGPKTNVLVEEIKEARQKKIFSDRKKKLIDFQPVVAKDIFKIKPKKPKDTESKEKNIKVTDLKLKLKGIILEDQKGAHAIILDGVTREQKLYNLNDTVQGARIVKITSERVIINVNGKEEALVMSFEPEKASSRRGAVRRPTRRVVQSKKKKYVPSKKIRRRPLKRPAPKMPDDMSNIPQPGKIKSNDNDI